MSELIKKRLREMLGDGLVTAYRCIDREYKPDNSGYEFFAVNLSYAEPYGDYCYKVQIDTNNAKILNLEKWNKLYSEKTGKNGNLINRHQGLFVIGSGNIRSGYELDLRHFASALGEEMANRFREEFNNCDAIYGEDAGYSDELVYAIKNKNIIKSVDKV